MEVYLIRHGETEWNKQRRLQGRTDIPLNDAGLAAARKAARNISALDFSLVLHSPLIRAKKTAEILRGERSCPIRKEEFLREISFGIGEGVHLHEDREEEKELKAALIRFFQDPGNYIPLEGGESIPALKKRVKSFIEEVLLPLEEEYREQRILIVAHGAVLRAVLDNIKNIPDESFWDGELASNCGGSILEVRDGKITDKQSIDLVNLEK